MADSSIKQTIQGAWRTMKQSIYSLKSARVAVYRQAVAYVLGNNSSINCMLDHCSINTKLIYQPVYRSRQLLTS